MCRNVCRICVRRALYCSVAYLRVRFGPLPPDKPKFYKFSHMGLLLAVSRIEEHVNGSSRVLMLLVLCPVGTVKFGRVSTLRSPSSSVWPTVH